MCLTTPRARVERSKSLVPAYSTSNVLQNEDSISRTVELLLGWMDKYAEERKPMHLSDYFSFVAFDNVGETLFSKSYGFTEQGIDIQGVIARNGKLSIYASCAGYFRWFHNLLANPLTTGLAILPTGFIFDRTMSIIEERLNNEDARYDIMAHWLKQKKEGRLTTRDIQAQATATTAAGGDTVSAALQSFVYHMIRLPGAWERARAEIDTARAELGICGDRVISYADSQKLRYVQACIKETLRIFPPVPMGLSRVVTKYGITIGDRSFPPGTSLSISIPVIHHSKEIWGPDASVFNPDRWLSEKSGDLERFYIPFGTGYNTCSGQHVGKIELSKIIPTIIRDYDIRQVDPKQEWKMAYDDRLSLTFGRGDRDSPLPPAPEDKTSNLAGSPEDARRDFNSWDSWNNGPRRRSSRDVIPDVAAPFAQNDKLTPGGGGRRSRGICDLRGRGPADPVGSPRKNFQADGAKYCGWNPQNSEMLAHCIFIWENPKEDPRMLH
ncbi:hypothetical protein DL769_008002 [Monosporascus sp. CRB-8-3]|nr:hypothetical protein DL769_008002 [Monosporascus sp. CRB-8-3]